MKQLKRSIGGFFPLEVENGGPHPAYHAEALALCSGRACLSFLLGKVAPTLVHVPFYCCDALLQPLKEQGIRCRFYALNADLEIDDAISLRDGEYIIYINYFGIKSEYCKKLVALYGARLLLDQTQAFFAKGPQEGWSFNSARKWFGVPDGGFLYGSDRSQPPGIRNPHYSTNHLVEKRWGNEGNAYEKFVLYENAIRSQVYRVSAVSVGLLATVDMQRAAKKRKKNFNCFHTAFKKDNLLTFEAVEDDVPFAYPLLLRKKVDKKRLHQMRIFVPTIWNDVLQRSEDAFEYEKFLSEHLLPLPVDHRYGKRDCRIVIDAIAQLM